jgi:hypothetical protein
MSPVLTERQQKWFASVRAGLERDTGRTVEQWAEIARACPETAHRKRLAWLKANHGLGQNHASLVLEAAFPSAASWSAPDALETALWKDAGQRAIFEAVKAAATALPEVVVGQRKGLTAFSRRLQFASVRPVKGGAALGLAVEPSTDPALREARNEGWSERLKATLTLEAPGEVDERVEVLLRRGWQRS